MQKRPRRLDDEPSLEYRPTEAVDTTIDPLHQLLAESRRWPLLTPRRGDRAVPAHRARRPGGQGAHDQLEPPTRRLRGAQVPGAGPARWATSCRRACSGSSARSRSSTGARASASRRTARCGSVRRSSAAWRTPAARSACPSTCRSAPARSPASSVSSRCKLGHEPSDEEIADAAELTVEEVEEIRAADQAPASLDKGVGDDGDTAFGDLLAADQLSPEEEVADAWQSEVLQSAVGELPEQERRVIELRFGAEPRGQAAHARPGRQGPRRLAPSAPARSRSARCGASRRSASSRRCATRPRPQHTDSLRSAP